MLSFQNFPFLHQHETGYSNFEMCLFFLEQQTDVIIIWHDREQTSNASWEIEVDSESNMPTYHKRR